MNRFIVMKESSTRLIHGFSYFQPSFRGDVRLFSHFAGNSELNSRKSMEGLVRCSANYVPLTPISFLERSAKVYSGRTSIVYGSVKYTWRETHERCIKLASALAQLGIRRGDVVATLAPNVPAMYELHFAVPMVGAVLCPLNTRYDPLTVVALLKHSEAKVIFLDYELLDVTNRALKLYAKTGKESPMLVLISEADGLSSVDYNSTAIEYESFVATGHNGFEIRRPESELDPISVNYTSGTTSEPKGVVYTHRGAFLNSLNTSFLHGSGLAPVYLWTVPMFHCNGWSFTWGIAAQGGANICLRKVSAKAIFDSIALHNVTHMGAAPIVLNMMANAPDIERKQLPHKVEVMIGGATPPHHIFDKLEKLGFGLTNFYGLTETYGPAAYCQWQPEWDLLTPDQRSKLKSRQGIHHCCVEDADVKDPATMESVKADGETIGEIMLRGNTVMGGYLKNLEATEEAFKDGWFRSGDVAVKHPDGYIEVKDRLKDIVISGGENISTIEVEAVLCGHPAVLEAAVVGRPDDHWGETPCAFVKLKQGFNANAEDILNFCRDNMARYMTPRTIVFDDLPKTSTGKVKKFILREKAKGLGSLS
ncbi:hypothetical protein K2173_023349 [Erythroxylum novogranatense]|uniref:4-coumarate--CoA ligase n=1 Tax=Erythroxylum novogranatense TaxID=1862640 RepID=A0AAV8TYB4_9ROSI|nr:hypothetical protein K2173_023349 [Erythroxylum novogranatense]